MGQGIESEGIGGEGIGVEEIVVGEEPQIFAHTLVVVVDLHARWAEQHNIQFLGRKRSVQDVGSGFEVADIEVVAG